MTVTGHGEGGGRGGGGEGRLWEEVPYQGHSLNKTSKKQKLVVKPFPSNLWSGQGGQEVQVKRQVLVSRQGFSQLLHRHLKKRNSGCSDHAHTVLLWQCENWAQLIDRNISWPKLMLRPTCFLSLMGTITMTIVIWISCHSANLSLMGTITMTIII